ncbi:hypothetical protein [Evansella tamaricis]|uniref:Uncharacterized protein n=1 Tax=Evansella tamaricis TaxID=2069301 RepID=A0ABS6JJJ4_9BACI|nr:hypothetical protein [Evansella tamaricis]MBU9713832.1 hypothetical protein [Evansella tamaricis]
MPQQRTGRPNIGHATGRGALPDERTGRPNIGHATGRGALPDERTGRPNIGHATGRDALPDERIFERCLYRKRHCPTLVSLSACSFLIFPRSPVPFFLIL